MKPFTVSFNSSINLPSARCFRHPPVGLLPGGIYPKPVAQRAKGSGFGVCQARARARA